jgi:lysophosphatidate acyltransferase
LPYLRFAFGYLVLAVGALPLIFILVLLAPFRVLRIRFALWLGSSISRAVLVCLGVKVVFHGPNPTTLTPAIFVGNHTSTIDVFLFAVSAPVGTSVVIKKEIIYVPIIGQIAWLSGNLLIDRDNFTRAKDGLSHVANMVKENGLSIYVMPEGTRSKTGEVQPFKRGFVHLAIATGLPVVPLVYRGAARRWPMGSFKVDPGEIHIDVLPAISSADWSAEEAGDIADEIRAQFVGALERDGES